jgi:hypothetical protein
MDEAQIMQEVEKIREEQASQEPMFNDMNYFGDGEINGDSEQTAELTSDSDRRGGTTNPFDSQD